LAGTAVGVATPKVPSVIRQIRQKAMAELDAPNLPPEALSALKGSSYVQRRVAGGMGEAEALHRAVADYHGRMRRAVAMGDLAPGAKLQDYIAKAGSAMPMTDEFLKIAADYLLRQVGKSKIRPQSAAPPNPKYRVKQAMIPTTPNPIGSTMETPEKRLAKAQRVGTPDDPNGPKFKPLNMLKPPKIASVKLGLAFATSDFAGGQLYPGPRSLSLPISGEAPSIPYARDPQLKYSGPPGDKHPKEKKANVISPAKQLSSSRQEGERKLTRPGPAAGNDLKPVGFGKPTSAKSWANRSHVV
jgi:hypothetical protein